MQSENFALTEADCYALTFWTKMVTAANCLLVPLSNPQEDPAQLWLILQLPTAKIYSTLSVSRRRIVCHTGFVAPCSLPWNGVMYLSVRPSVVSRDLHLGSAATITHFAPKFKVLAADWRSHFSHEVTVFDTMYNSSGPTWNLILGMVWFTFGGWVCQLVEVMGKYTGLSAEMLSI